MARPVKKQNINKIAEQAGVSIFAVSCVVNNRPGVSDETRARIAAIIEQHGYTRNYRRTDGRTIGLVLPCRGSNWYVSAVIDGVMAYAAEESVNIATIIYPGSSKTLPILLREHFCDVAIILHGSRISSEVESVVKAGIPVILIGAKAEKADFDDGAMIGYVDNDSYQGSYDLTKYLIGLGHREIMFVNRILPFSEPNSNARILGWQDAMLESGVPVKELQTSLYHVEDSMTGVRTLPLKKRSFTALMANDDAMALICLCLCHEMGIRVPDDLSVTGFGNMNISEFFAPPLTTVDQKTLEVGYEAAKHAGELAGGWCMTPPHLVLPTEVVIRKSSASPCRL